MQAEQPSDGQPSDLQPSDGVTGDGVTGDGVTGDGITGDGRAARSVRTRRAIVDALRALHHEGDLRPRLHDVTQIREKSGHVAEVSVHKRRAVLFAKPIPLTRR